MKSFGRIVPGVLLLLWIAVTLEPRALAYVDPGSGLLLMQTIGAVVTATAFWFRRQIRSVISRFRSPSQKTQL